MKDNKPFWIHPSLAVAFLSQANLGFFSNVFILGYMIIERDYPSWLKAFDSGISIFAILFLIALPFMRRGIIPGYYRYDYSPMEPFVQLYGLFFSSTIVRIFLYYGVQFINLRLADAIDKVIVLRKITEYFKPSPVMLFTLAILFLIFYALFFLKKEIPIASYYGYNKKPINTSIQSSVKQTQHVPAKKVEMVTPSVVVTENQNVSTRDIGEPKLIRRQSR